MAMQAAKQTSMVVRSPAGRPCSSLSNPITRPARPAHSRRTARSDHSGWTGIGSPFPLVVGAAPSPRSGKCKAILPAPARAALRQLGCLCPRGSMGEVKRFIRPLDVLDSSDRFFRWMSEPPEGGRFRGCGGHVLAIEVRQAESEPDSKESSPSWVRLRTQSPVQQYSSVIFCSYTDDGG